MQNCAEFLLPSDAAHLLDLTPAAIKLAVRTGRLQVAAKTTRGVHLFRLEDVESFKKTRAERRRQAISVDPDGR